jgi:hypothetical protein
MRLRETIETVVLYGVNLAVAALALGLWPLLLVIAFVPGTGPFSRWAWFGNAEDGPDGDANYARDYGGRWWFKLTWTRRFMWGLRNFGHNLTWHVLGFVGDVGGSMQNQGMDQLGWLHILTQRHSTGKVYRLVGYTGLVLQAYIGWRANGAFGFKCRRRSQG